ncbi:ABC transporter permease [archaeon]|jgi:putative ABC transport system permease protein|nr:ABC transporter permease [archaeon]MBT4373083.1 ABC transporter permease [archaeon]MBT4531428.1 ABC transporter permease [archaeon]MBT7001394.1 ABC transporter permease [archaeon]MBT7282120.1 ABC transporter permease [archaeon]
MLLDYFLLSFNNLRRRKLRSWLTMLGIFIGIAAVVALISLGQGLQNYINDEFEKLGSDKIVIYPRGMGPPGSATSSSLIITSKDLGVIENVRGVKWVVGFLAKQSQIGVKDETDIAYIMGADADDLELLSEVQSFAVLEGRQLEKGDKNKAVVGYNHIYGDLWDKQLKIGSMIKVEGVEFRIVGVLAKIGNSIDDKTVYVPKATLREILNIVDEESQILAKTEEGFDPAEVADNIERKLRKFRNEKEDEETFVVQTSEELLNTFQSIFGVVQAVLVGIAAISLLVGGIGIMNTMYTAVLERTKEIGTMKAVGAKNSDVLLIFLFESGLLGLVGGAIGVGIGVGMAKSAEYLAASALGSDLLQASFPMQLILGALLFSFTIGSFSGLLPAIQAAKLKPVDALRYE